MMCVEVHILGATFVIITRSHSSRHSWIGTGAAADGPTRFTGNDILRFADGRFVEYWTGTSSA